MRRGIALPLAVMLCAAVSSCGKGPVPHTVEGTILYDGKPLKNAAVTFHPDREDSPSIAAISGDAGEFSLQCPPGTYTVTAEIPGPAGSGHPTPLQRLLAIYGDADTSPLKVEVPTQARNLLFEIR